MDIAFELLIPSDEITSELHFEQPYFEWDGVAYPQGNEQATYQYFKLEKSTIPDYILRLVPATFQQAHLDCVRISDGVDVLYEKLQTNGEETTETSLLNMLNEVLGKTSKWIVVFEPRCDQIDEVLNADIQEVNDKICASLLQERKGYVFWKCVQFQRN